MNATLQPRRVTGARGLVRLTLVILMFAAMPGCGGCWGKDALSKKRAEALARKKKEEEEGKKKEKPKPDFEAEKLRVLTSDRSTAARVLVKPGHWTTTTQRMRANNFDLSADLRSAAVNRAEQPLDIEHTSFSVAMARPIRLPKEQIKTVEVDYYVPRRVKAEERSAWLQSKVVAQRSGRELGTEMQPVTAMPAYQYYFLALASDPDRYGYLKSLASVKPPSDPLSAEENLLFYQVFLSKADRRAPVPERSLAWTSIAFVLWDDLNPSVWSIPQQEALLDWLHWGGQLIVSGPNSLGRLKGSFLEDYLPADEVKAIELNGAAFEEMSNFWSPTEKQAKQSVKRIIELPEGVPMVGIEMEPRPEGVYLPNTGKLAIERRVGRGRIVVTAFSLNSLAGRALVNWPGFDSFFNSCLLRRPARDYYEATEEQSLRFRWHTLAQHIKDARLSTSLRYFARDVDDVKPANRAPVASETDLLRYAGGDPGASSMGMPTIMDFQPQFTDQTPPTDASDPNQGWRFGGFAVSNQSGVGGWNDFSGAANAARVSLKESAGIDVPEASFVLKALGAYLLVLAPLNWLFFRLIGRVEWAWISAPIIAICGAAAVVYLAQLDIGFARSRTEIAVLETQPGHARGHLTRYSALYTSLSSQYGLGFNDESALALPFSTDPEHLRPAYKTSSLANFRRGEGESPVALRDFTVISNTTEMVHSEQMLPLGGRIQLAGESLATAKVTNSSNFPVRDCGVIARTDEGVLQAAWIGDLEAGAARAVQWSPIKDAKRLYFPQWEKSLVTRRGALSPNDPTAKEVRLWRLLEVAVQRLELQPGDVRLIGWTDQAMPGVEIRPVSPQETFRTVLVSHLRYGRLPDPKMDAKTPWQFAEELRRPAPPDEETEAPPEMTDDAFLAP